MNSTVELIFTVAGAALTLLAVYGALKLDRKLFLSGVCFFSILPIIGESMAYNADKAPIHIIVIFIFLAQFVLAFPNNIVYGQDNVAATKLSTKIALAILIFNIGGALFILCLTKAVPAQFGYYHIVIGLSIIYLMIKRITTDGAAWIK
ncbi:MAG TPA: hypothetical protein VNW95_11570 [Mucilaginibacter sp.]|jgi:hypothetical protein|nr:hypothetical protein [Mucilaginibacter sp.]